MGERKKKKMEPLKRDQYEKIPGKERQEEGERQRNRVTNRRREKGIQTEKVS